jgi:serine/threonine protein kinase
MPMPSDYLLLKLEIGLLDFDWICTAFIGFQLKDMIIGHNSDNISKSEEVRVLSFFESIINLNELIRYVKRIQIEEGRMDEGPVTFVLNGYEFQECIGRGTYSTAYKVLSVQYQSLFCAKMTELDDRFFREDEEPNDPELEALLALDHENVIRVYKYFKYDSMFFLILEYFPEGSLMDLLERQGRLSISNLWNFTLDLLKALVYCHDQNIAHRDIKPANIFLDSHQHVKIGDFGLASWVTKSQITGPCGSPNYAAPEIYCEDGYDYFKADVWSLGVTIYQMATASFPWSEDVMAAGPERPEPVYPSDMHQDIAEILAEMLRVDPRRRPSMKEILKSWRELKIFAAPRARISSRDIALPRLSRKLSASALLSLDQVAHSMRSQRIMPVAHRLSAQKRRCIARSAVSIPFTFVPDA